MKTRNADELLKKVRKDATAGFNVQDWLFCLDTLGWSWVKTVVDREARYLITAPNGETFKLQKEPGYRGIVFYGTGNRDGFIDFAKRNGIEAAIEAKIGAEPERAPRRDMTNTGTCSCCFGNFKLRAAKTADINPDMVFHGYQRPGTGYTVGQCYGINYAPYELSCEGTKAFIKLVESERETSAAWLKHLESAAELTIRHGEGRKVTPAHGYEFDAERRLQIANTEYRIKCIDRDLAFLNEKVSTWVRRPLPC